MCAESRFRRGFRLAAVLVLAALPIPALAQEDSLAEDLFEQAVKDLQNMTEAAKIVAKRGGRSAARIAGPLDALIEVLDNGPAMTCAFWRIELNKTLRKLGVAVAEDPTPENLQTLQRYHGILNRIAVACDKPVKQDQGVGDGPTEGDQGAPQPAEDDGSPHDLTPEEKKCWPLCREAWAAVDSALKGLELRLDRVETAVNEATETEKMLQEAQHRLQVAQQAVKAHEERQRYSGPRSPRGVNPATEARRAAVDKEQMEAGNEVRARKGDAARAKAAAEQANLDLSTWLAELAARRIAYRQCLAQCAVTAEKRAGGGKKKWILVGGGLAAGGVAIAAGGSSGTTPPPPGTSPPATAPPATTPPADTRLGTFNARLAVILNPGRHPDLIDEILTVLVTAYRPSSSAVGVPISVRVTASDPQFIPVEGTVDDAGRLQAGGGGNYAGFSTSAALELTIAGNSVSGRYTIGADGRLPGGQPIAWSLTGTRLP